MKDTGVTKIGGAMPRILYRIIRLVVPAAEPEFGPFEVPFDEPFSIRALAQPGEEFLTQFIVRRDDEQCKDRKTAEENLRKYYAAEGYTQIRFHYGTLELSGCSIHPKEFGKQCVTPNVRAVAYGGAVFGVPPARNA